MRKLLAAVAAATVLGAVAPAASRALSAPDVAPVRRVSADLEAALASGSSDPMVVLVRGSDRAAALGAVEDAGLHLVDVLETVDVAVASGSPAAVRDVLDQPGVAYVERDHALSLFADDTADVATRTAEARAADSPVLKTTTPTTGKGKKGKGKGPKPAPSEPGVPFTGAGESIAIVDSGVDGTHPMFTDPATGESKVVVNMKLACTNDGAFVLPDTCPEGEDVDPFFVDFTPVNDTDTPSMGGHGTHVAGIAAGYPVQTSDGRTLMGTAPGAKVVSLSIGQTLTIYGSNAALDWIVRHHADPCGDGSCPPITVVNNSYGGGTEFDPESATTLLQDALVDAGVVVVWANGNGDQLNDGGDGSDNRSGSDAQDPKRGSISVANYDDGETGTRDGTLSSSSSRGDRTQPATWPDVSAPGTNITSSCRPYLAICDGALGPDSNYGTISGTSMASPHVVGIVALLREADPTLTPAQVQDVLEGTAHKFTFGASYQDAGVGSGTSSFDKGHGLVDTTAALASVLGRTAPPPPPAEGGAACTPGAPLVSDPADDATTYAVTDTGTSEPNLDVTSVEVVGDAANEGLRVGFHVTDLTEEGPAMSTGSSFEGTLGIGDASYDVGAEHGPAGDIFYVGDADVTGSFDTTNDVVWIDVPRATIGDPAGLVTVGSLAAGFTRYRYSPVPVFGPAADSFAGACPQTVDVGGTVAPPPGPVATVAPGAPYTWTSEPATVVSEPSGLTEASVTAEGTREESKLVTVTAPAGATLTFSIVCANPADDYDIELHGPDGAPIGLGAVFVEELTGEPTVGRSANPGCGESITVENAPAGDYTATITAFTTAHGTYDGTIELS